MKIKHIDYPNVDYSVLTDRERQLKACRELYAIFCLTNNRGITDEEIGEIAKEMGMTGYAGITLDRIVSANLVRWHKVVKEVCGSEEKRWFRKEKQPGESKGKYYLHPDFASRIPNLSKSKPQTCPSPSPPQNTQHRSNSVPQISPSLSIHPPMVGLMIDEPMTITEADVKIETKAMEDDVSIEPFDESWMDELLNSDFMDIKSESDSELDFPEDECSDSELEFPDDDDDDMEDGFLDTFSDLKHQIMMDELRGTKFPILRTIY